MPLLGDLLCPLRACAGLNADGTCPMGYGRSCEGYLVPAPGPPATLERLIWRVETGEWTEPLDE